MFIAADLEELHNAMAEDAKQKLDYHTSTNSSTSAESKSKRAPTKKVEKEQGAVNAREAITYYFQMANFQMFLRAYLNLANKISKASSQNFQICSEPSQSAFSTLFF